MPPFFEENPLTKLAGLESEAGAELDLRGLDRSRAIAKVEALLSGTRVGQTYHIRFDAADGERGETLFLPIGRRLLEARRAGQLTRCLPLRTGDGYYIELGNTEDAGNG
jgi:hypothetical protein